MPMGSHLYSPRLEIATAPVPLLETEREKQKFRLLDKEPWPTALGSYSWLSPFFAKEKRIESRRAPVTVQTCMQVRPHKGSSEKTEQVSTYPAWLAPELH